MLDDYALFAAIVEAGSLSAAARSLNLSTAMVSRRLARMERRLGARLIRRTTRRLSLTDVGQAFHERVGAILLAAREAEAMVAGRAGTPSGRLRVSAPTSFGRMHVAPRLKDFLDAYPDIVLEFDLDDGFADMWAERIDVAIRIGPPPGAGFAAILLAANRRVICAAPAYLAAHGAPEDLAALAGHRILAATGQLPWRLEGPGGPVLFDAQSHVRTNSSEVVRELTLAGAGIALRSTWDVAAELRDGRLRPILPGHEGAADIGIHAVRPGADPAPPNARVFIDFLRGLFAPTPPWEGRPVP